MSNKGAPFKPGQSGNPGGRPKTVGIVQELARQHTEAAIHTLVEIAEHGESEAARVAAANAILDRAWGKPVQPLDGDGEGGPIKLSIPVRFINARPARGD